MAKVKTRTFRTPKAPKASGDRTPSEWVEQINLGLTFRRLFGLEDTWTDLEAKFHSVSEGCDTAPNLLASKGDTIVSALSVPEVGVMVKPRTLEASKTAPIVQAFDSSMLEGLEVGDVMEELLVNAFLFGVGLMKVGYDSEYGFDPKMQLGPLGGTLSQFDSKGRMIESGLARSGFPWVCSVDPRDVVVPWGTKKLEDASWIAHRVVRPIEDVKSDQKYSGTSELEGQVSMRDIVLGYSKVKDDVEDQKGEVEAAPTGPEGEKDHIELWEVMDRRSKKIIVIALGETPTEIRRVENTLQVDNQLPWVSLRLGLPTRAFWITPPAYYAAPHQIELDDIHLQAKKQRRASIMKIIGMKGAFDEANLAALLSGEPGMYVEVENVGTPLRDSVMVTGGNSSLNVLLQQEGTTIESNAREALGISKNSAGEYNPRSRTSATETEVVQQGGETRMGRKQKALRMAYRHLVILLNGIVAKHWTMPQAVRVVGADGVETWELFRAEMLDAGRFTFEISFSAEFFETPQRRQQSALGLYQTLMADSRVDKEALLQELLASFGSPSVRKGKAQGPPGGGEPNALQLPVSKVPQAGGSVPGV